MNQRIWSTIRTKNSLRLIASKILKIEHVCPQIVVRRYEGTLSDRSGGSVPRATHTLPIISCQQDFELKLPTFINADCQLALFFDYDGTLASIADHPKNTNLSEDVQNLLNKIVKCQKIRLAIITGRLVDDIQNKVNFKDRSIDYAGNHGLEIQTRDGSRHDYELSIETQEVYKHLIEELNKKCSINNAWIEDKRVSLTYHFKNTPANLKEKQRQLAKEIIESYGYTVTSAHDGLEGRPPVKWNKGSAALFLLEHCYGSNWAKNIKVIYAGDDFSDEDAMKALKCVAKTFRISSDPSIQTAADFILPSQEVVVDLLKWIIKIYKL
ncbi:probable trehalose-phosphate phosphatase C [Teleopsis dalmanni]|uniref:probable trehalose-phosphate phosphatase C n=1 Tax=Teleopsis dalmanni TaxID=139649 RepID=UPI0018CF090A|nr:probable trehalose-phosphate phosphatase C [Teleopsis dalmanni]